MRILFLNPSGQLGGAELSLLDVMASLHDRQPDWKLGLVASDVGPLIDAANALGIETHVMPFPARLSQLGDASLPSGRFAATRFATTKDLALSALPAWGYKRRLARVIRTFAPDVIHTNGFKMHVLGAMASNGRPVLWHVRDFVSTRPVMARLLRQVAGAKTMVVANSNAVAEDVRKVLDQGVPDKRNRVRTIHNAIDLKQFSPDGSALDLDRLSGLPPAAQGTVRVGLVATMAFWKGHETFLRALALLPNDFNDPNATNVRGYVIGDRIYQTSSSQHSLAELRSLAAKLGIADRVGFTGHVSDSAAAMRSLDIVVHASTRPEPFGRVIAEAMACGRAVITSAHGGASEIITPDADALTHEAGNERSLADGIARLAADRELRQRMSKAGLERARTQFDRKRLADELIPIYEELAGLN